LSSLCSSAAASVITASAATRCSQAENSIAGVACIAAHDHVLHVGLRVGGDRVPGLEPLEQLDGRRIERVGAHVVGGGGARRAAQRDREAEARERQGEALADDTGAAHLHIEDPHRDDCRERSETIRSSPALLRCSSPRPTTP
jgi:hypothetical protein